jgi:[histone H4]-N-methyl-L-lysine20 N-methyltransferase
LCATCERRGKGGYSSHIGEDEEQTLFTAVLREYESDSSIGPGSSDDEPESPVNVNERRTRRGVYHVVKEKGKKTIDDFDFDEEVDSQGLSPMSIPINC